MKKERLRAAFDTIQIIADNGFVEDSLYKRSHQVKQPQGDSQQTYEIISHILNIKYVTSTSIGAA